MRRELEKKLLDKFGIERLKPYRKLLHSELISTDDEIGNWIRKETDKINTELAINEHYDDIDCVIAGLTRAKANPKLKIWAKFSKNLIARFPNAKHPPLDRGSRFGYWEIYNDFEGAEYVVSDYRLEIPMPKEPTKIHFMLYRSDERFGMKFFGNIPTDHTPSKDVSLEMWKEQQEKDNLPFLAIAEF